MLLLTAIFAVLSVLSVAASAPENINFAIRKEPSPFIISPNIALSGQYPSVVSFRTPTVALQHCNGVIINPNHILTSCRCVYDDQNALINPLFLRIIAGDLNIMRPSYRRITTNVIRIYPHPQFNPQTGNNDIAVLRVENPFPFPLNTIDISRRNDRVLPNGFSCRTVGWGAQGAVGAAANLGEEQRFVDQQILDRDVCNGPTVHAGRVLENMLCAGVIGASPNAAVCHGNLGAGIFCDNELTGILSFGLGCGAANQPAVFTQIRFFDAWINQQFTRQDIVIPGTVIGNL